MTNETPIRGLVIRQSLKHEVLHSNLEVHLSGSHQHNLGGQQEVEILEFLVERTNLWPVMCDLSKLLKPKRFYAHFIDGNYMYVVFPYCVVIVVDSDISSLKRAQAIGDTFGIPTREMRFLEIFKADHPNEK